MWAYKENKFRKKSSKAAISVHSSLFYTGFFYGIFKKNIDDYGYFISSVG